MRREIILATTAIGMSLMFNGCVTAIQDNVQGVLNTVDAPFKSLAKAIDNTHNTIFNSKVSSTDNLEPWDIKKSTESHYVLDPFFALPTAKTKTEAEQQIKEILSKISVVIKRWGDKENARLTPLRDTNGRCAWVYKANIEDGIFAWIKEVQPYCGKGGTYRYIGFSPRKVNGVWYMVVGATNAKNVGLFSGLGDAIAELKSNNYDMPRGFTTPWYNHILSGVITAGVNAYVKKNNLSERYVDIHLDSKHPEAKKYRENFVKFFKKDLK